MAKPRVVILGGGFGGLYTAQKLEKLRGDKDDFDITLISKDNYFVYQPMLAEIISGHVGIYDTISPLRQLLPKTDIVVRAVESIDLENRIITTSPGLRPVESKYSYDYLVVALGNVTDFRGMTGLTQHALRFKFLSDAVTLRNHAIHMLEEASVERDPEQKKALLTFVVAGGGWSGVECAAELNDFVRHVAKKYRGIDPKEIRVILLQGQGRILTEMEEDLAILAQGVLKKNGVEIRLETRLDAATGGEAILKSGERIRTKTLVSTIPSSPNPIVDALTLPKDKDRKRIKTNAELQVEGSDHIWALGDCAWIPNPAYNPDVKNGERADCPPTAQHAVREGYCAAHNIVTVIRGGEKKQFAFKGLGQMGALGHHAAVAQAFGMKFSGLLAWMMWRAVYLQKLPGWDRQVRTGMAWLMSMFLPTDTVQLRQEPGYGVVQEHYHTGQNIFEQGDLGDRLYIIIKGRVEVIQTIDGITRKLNELKEGAFFGEMALLNVGQSTRGATIRAIEPLDVLSVPKHDINALVDHLPALRESFREVIDKREAMNQKTNPEPTLIIRRKEPSITP